MLKSFLQKHLGSLEREGMTPAFLLNKSAVRAYFKNLKGHNAWLAEKQRRLH
jgi:hypothetical protein